MKDHVGTLIDMPRRKRSVLLPIRVTPEERDAIRAVAKRENMTVSGFIRSAVALKAQDMDREPLGRWLVDNVPRGTGLDVPRERGSLRRTPFAGDDLG